jgi:hypothetical protein
LFQDLTEKASSFSTREGLGERKGPSMMISLLLDILLNSRNWWFGW